MVRLKSDETKHFFYHRSNVYSITGPGHLSILLYHIQHKTNPQMNKYHAQFLLVTLDTRLK